MPSIQIAPIQTGSKKARLCLRCGEKFLSEGPYNRVCEDCSVINARVYKNEYKIITTRNKKINPQNDLESLEELFG